MSFFDPSAATYIRALIRLRRAAGRFLSTPSSTASLDRLLRARLREIDAANAYREVSRNFFRAALGCGLRVLSVRYNITEIAGHSSEWLCPHDCRTLSHSGRLSLQKRGGSIGLL
jgi:hypothetical protein